MRRGLRPGIAYTLFEVVVREKSIDVSRVGAIPRVYSTPSMLELIERTAHELLKPYLGPSEVSVALWTSISHLASVPLRTKVSCRVTLKQVKGRLCTFQAEVKGRGKRIGEGEHTRLIIGLNSLSRIVLKRKPWYPYALPSSLSLSRAA